MGAITMGPVGSAPRITNSGTKQDAVINLVLPEVPAGAAMVTASQQLVFTGTVHQDASQGAAGEFIPLNATGDPTTGGLHPLFTDNATLMPLSCGTLTLFAFQGPQSGGDVTVTLYRSTGGTESPTSTGLSVTVANGAGGHAELSIPITAGDLLAYQVTGPNVASNGVKLSVGLVCHGAGSARVSQ
jgi:hypothetical protein